MTFAGAEAGEPVAGPWVSADQRRAAEAVEGVAGPVATERKPSAGQVQLRPYEPADAAATWKVFHAAVRNTALACHSAEQVAAWAPDDVDADRWAHRRAAAWTLVAIHNTGLGTTAPRWRPPLARNAASQTALHPPAT